jgi:hypothetical protein
MTSSGLDGSLCPWFAAVAGVTQRGSAITTPPVPSSAYQLRLGLQMN